MTSSLAAPPGAATPQVSHLMSLLVGGVLVATGVLVAGAQVYFNFLAGYAHGTTPSSAAVYGFVNALADVAKVATGFGVFLLIRYRHWGLAALLVVLWSLLVWNSFTAVASFVGENRLALLSDLQARNSGITDVKEDIDRLQQQLGWIPQHRPAAVVEPLLAAAKADRRFRASDNCRAPSSAQAEHCRQVAGLESELGSAAAALRISEQIGALKTKRAGLGVVRAEDGQTTLLSLILGTLPFVKLDAVATAALLGLTLGVILELMATFLPISGALLLEKGLIAGRARRLERVAANPLAPLALPVAAAASAEALEPAAASPEPDAPAAPAPEPEAVPVAATALAPVPAASVPSVPLAAAAPVESAPHSEEGDAGAEDLSSAERFVRAKARLRGTLRAIGPDRPAGVPAIAAERPAADSLPWRELRDRAVHNADLVQVWNFADVEIERTAEDEQRLPLRAIYDHYAGWCRERLAEPMPFTRFSTFLEVVLSRKPAKLDGALVMEGVVLPNLVVAESRLRPRRAA